MSDRIGEKRKVVTVLFCDLVDSTPLGERLDPEALRGLLAGYFERMKMIVERHGGTVEKFIGDAVMAVFGVPVLHEDDALRACRAAVEMRDALPELGLGGRIGVNTGEVVTGTEERLATGDVVNVAARLEQAAARGEVLVGEPALAFVGGAVEVEPVEALSLKGKSEPVRAYRLVSVSERPERPHRSRFVGRADELALLRELWERARLERRYVLATVVGEAGIGKSRLVAEALTPLDARVVRGRCLPYGDGITYWPVVEVLKQLRALPADPAAAASIRSLLGETEQGTSAEEIAWAFRTLLAEQSPLIVVFDDLHWGEETFLDLLEGVELLPGGATIMLVCMARPELLERRPGWPVALRLESLPPDAADELIRELDADLRSRIARAAGGNPLFLTEMAAIAAEGGDVEVPATLKAVAAARLDQLDRRERRLLECGAVEGEIFHRGALQALALDEAQLTPRLTALVRRGLIRPDKSLLPGDEAFRFRHLLLRDAAYDALSKATRAELHERFANWLDQHAAALVELDELLGYHLEQAVRYRAELGTADADLAVRAGARLAAAGRLASWRGDWSAAASLLERASSLVRPVKPDIALELDLARALRPADPRRSVAVAREAEQAAEAAGDRLGALAARLAALESEIPLTGAAPDELEALAREALPELEQSGDHAGLVHAWIAVAAAARFRCRHEDNARAVEQALHHARLAGQRLAHQYGLPIALVEGPRPADEALRTLEAIQDGRNYPVTALARAWLNAMLDRTAEARRLADEAAQRYRDVLGNDHELWALAQIATLSGDHERAAALLRDLNRRVEERGELAYLSTYAPLLGRSLCALGRHEEAAPLAARGRDLGDEQDAITQALWRQVQALVHASRGEHEDAERLAREAVAIAEQTDHLTLQGDALSDLADCLVAARRRDEGAAALAEALKRYERKLNLPLARRARKRLTALLPTPSESTTVPGRQSA